MLLEVLSPDSIDISSAAATVSTLDRLLNHLIDLATTLGLKIIAAIVVFIIGRWVIGWLRKLINRFLTRRHIEKTVSSFLDSLVNITLKIVLLLLIVNILGIETTSFAAILAAAGLAIGMAMKDNLSNFAGGVMLLINNPFKVGDRIVVQGMDGTVQSIGILYTVLLTADNITIYVPNGPLSTGNITNYSAQKERRVDITFNINYGADVDVVKNILNTVIVENKLIKDDPAPFVGVTRINNGNIDVSIKAWVNSSDYTTVSVDLNESIYKALTEEGVYVSSTVSVRMLKD
ncbi:MAG: mechanosensitive ion channel family protein [Prevotella sp.]|jgi:small conductance mechanosensitive channel|nr:mechanosensitive ion channel family protein [Prevotella sp.]